ncbi:hypothetical protein AAF712_007198 [Marasmius tenuissimus]|uniref:C2H2-type domain-containing protein n=1 Tax=Marasmius tenuissimus TaxID=585030 RepID=A0ABR2ZVK1_9AGAR
MPSTLTAQQIAQRQKPKPARTIPCPVQGCSRFFPRPTVLSNHLNVHRDLVISSDDDDGSIAQSDSESQPVPVDDEPSPNSNTFNDSFDNFQPGSTNLPSAEDNAWSPPITHMFHEHINARRCDSQGHFLPNDAPPPPDPAPCKANDWSPWASGLEFRAANLLYRKMQTSAGHINKLTEIITALTNEQAAESLFDDAMELYSTIDACQNGAIPWEAFSVSYNGPRLPGKTEPWMEKELTVYF